MEESHSSLPVLPRLDRLDRLVQLLEEKHGLSGSWRCLCKNEDNKQQKQEEKCSVKALSSVLDEVQHKGSLLERLTILENRVFQLSLDIEEDERNTSKSSSTVVVAAAGGGGGSDTLSTGNSGEQEKEQILSPFSFKEQSSKKTCDLGEIKKDHDISSSRSRSNKKSYKKMLGWLRMGC